VCFELDSRPPLLPIAGAAVNGKDVTLTSGDGTRFMSYAARAAKSSGAGMIVLPDVRGLHSYYKELAERFAEAGLDAVAIDYFARTADTSDRGENFDFMSHVAKTEPHSVQADVAAAAAYLRSNEGGSVRSLFSMGFCFGGSIASLTASWGLDLKGVVPMYGWPDGSPRRPNWPAPVSKVGEFTCPVLAIYGGADEGIPPEARDRFENALREHGVKHLSKTYEGAPHSFFDRRYAEFDEVCKDSWRTILAFIQDNS
jgi:carboxymethylenebutenolidase